MKWGKKMLQPEQLCPQKRYSPIGILQIAALQHKFGLKKRFRIKAQSAVGEFVAMHPADAEKGIIKMESAYAKPFDFAAIVRQLSNGLFKFAFWRLHAIGLQAL